MVSDYGMGAPGSRVTCMHGGHSDDGTGHPQQSDCVDPVPFYRYTITISATVTVESESEIPLGDLRDIARDERDHARLWVAKIEGPGLVTASWVINRDHKEGGAV